MSCWPAVAAATGPCALAVPPPWQPRQATPRRATPRHARPNLTSPAQRPSGQALTATAMGRAAMASAGQYRARRQAAGRGSGGLRPSGRAARPWDSMPADGLPSKRNAGRAGHGRAFMDFVDVLWLVEGFRSNQIGRSPAAACRLDPSSRASWGAPPGPSLWSAARSFVFEPNRNGLHHVARTKTVRLHAR